MVSQRINKVIANHGICSRRKVDSLIKDKKILVNGNPAAIGMKVNPSVDDIKIDGKKLGNSEIVPKVILLNKPKNIITSCSDKHNRKTVIDLLPSEYRKGFFPVGRLDFLSRGALLITNNGNLCYKLSHPRFEHKKIYIVKINGDLNQNQIDNWRKGINLEGKKTNPCKIEIIKKDLKNTTLKITLKEGRNRQIRKIVNLMGHKVLDLKRINFANIKLGNLKEGEWILISVDEIS